MYKVNLRYNNKTIKTKLYRTDESYLKYSADLRQRYQMYEIVSYKLVNDDWVKIPQESVVVDDSLNQKINKKFWLITGFETEYTSGPGWFTKAFTYEALAKQTFEKLSQNKSCANVELHVLQVSTTRYKDPEWGWENLPEDYT